ncbi:MAG: galactokinase, partial [Clostridiales bacterium]|nr:galactokinase [Clostridiales bacterium]
MKTTDLLQGLESERFDAALAAVYGADVPRQKARIREAVGEFETLYGAGRDVMVCSAPGRTEVCGNHTDHNHGKVLAAAVNLDALAIVARNEDGIAQVKSKGYRLDQVSLEELEPSEAENGKAVAMLRGMLARLKELGYIVGGFSAYTTSDVLSGSGLSSSAAYVVLLGTVGSQLFNGGGIDPVVVAQAAQYAENVFFGKPSGLLDQMTASVGGFVTIDFADPAAPVIERVDYDFSASGHTLCIVDTGGSHADLTDEYAAVRSEMEDVARALGQDVLRRVDPGAFRAQIAALRDKVGDRAVLRAMHFFQENDRVDAAVAA